MNDKQQYNTKRRAELLEYLQSMQGRHVTVNDIRAWFMTQDKPIGTATIYRQLDHMVEQGLINKYMLDETSAACYEYVGIHLHCHELEKMQGHLAQEHGFRLDFPRTVLYGLCQQCGAEAAT